MPATREAYAVCAFNISNLENLLAFAEAAVKENSPAVIAVSPTSIDYAGLTYIETVVRCLDAGFTSIMIDGSSLEFEANVALTKRIVDLARPRDVSGEAELGRIVAVDEFTTEEKQAILTDPESAVPVKLLWPNSGLIAVFWIGGSSRKEATTMNSCVYMNLPRDYHRSSASRSQTPIINSGMNPGGQGATTLEA